MTRISVVLGTLMRMESNPSKNGKHPEIMVAVSLIFSSQLGVSATVPSFYEQIISVSLGFRGKISWRSIAVFPILPT